MHRITVVKGDGDAIGLMDPNQHVGWYSRSRNGKNHIVGEFEVSAESIKKKQSKGPDVKHHEQV